MVDNPIIEVSLQFDDAEVYLAPEYNLVTLLQDPFVKTSANAVSLRVANLGLRSFNVFTPNRAHKQTTQVYNRTRCHGK